MLSSYFKIDRLVRLSQNGGNPDPLNNGDPLGDGNPEQPVQPPVNEVQPAAPVAPAAPANQAAVPAAPAVAPADNQAPQGQRQLAVLQNHAWGKTGRITAIVRLEGLTEVEFKKLQGIAKKFVDGLKDGNGKYPEWATWKNTKNRNKIEPAPFFVFSKAQIDGPYFHVMISDKGAFDAMNAALKGIGFNTAPLEEVAMQVAAGGEDQAGQQPLADEKTVEVKVPTWDAIAIRFNYNQEIMNYIRQERIGGQEVSIRPIASYVFSRQKGTVPSQLHALASFMRKREYNVQDFIDAIDKYDQQLTEKNIAKLDPNKILVVEDASVRTKFFMFVRSPQTPGSREELGDFIKFSFPSKGNLTDLRPEKYDDIRGGFVPQQPQLPMGGNQDNPANPQEQPKPERHKPTGMRLEQNNGWFIWGSFDDFVRFSLLLKKSQWDVNSIRILLARLLNDKKLERTRYTGELDGYAVIEDGVQKRKNGELEWDYNRFFNETDAAVPGAKLFKKQKQGVAWLYQRNSAILGDKTGTGKTLSTIAAAKMRVAQSGGRVLIFTLKNTQTQWMREIVQKLGEDPAQVSSNPASNAKWVIMSYSDISSNVKKGPEGAIRRPSGAPTVARATSQAYLDALYTGQWTVVVFDEAHMLKNETTSIAKNLSDLAPKIPFKWAASATPAANTAADIHNVLRITGHTLGELSTRDFTNEFIGSKATMKNMDVKEAIEAQEKGAYNLRKWLTLSGAYLSRSQKSMNPDIPQHTIGEEYIDEADFDMDGFAVELQNKLNAYKNPNAAICNLTASRLVLAKRKVPKTLADATALIDQGEKVLIFSCFKDTCRDLVRGLQEHLAGIDPDLKVVHVMDGDKGANIQAAVDEFKREDTMARAMVVAALKGGTGISMENTTQHVLMNDFDWTPRVCEQAEGRAFRINNFMPVNTRYMVVRAEGVDANGNKKLNPDEVFYRFVRNKIRIAGIVQDLDAKAEETLLAGMDDTEVQQQLKEARAEDRANQAQLAADLNEILRQAGKDAAFQDNLNPDLWEEERELNEGGENDPNQPRQAFGTWYRRIIG